LENFVLICPHWSHLYQITNQIKSSSHQKIL
jgi:hypothetical protein